MREARRTVLRGAGRVQREEAGEIQVGDVAIRCFRYGRGAGVVGPPLLEVLRDYGMYDREEAPQFFAPPTAGEAA